MKKTPRKLGRPPTYGFGSLGIGDSLSFSVQPELARKAALQYARRYGFEFSTRKSEGVLIVTRVE